MKRSDAFLLTISRRRSLMNFDAWSRSMVYLVPGTQNAPIMRLVRVIGIPAHAGEAPVSR
jgi:hypothetical protein